MKNIDKLTPQLAVIFNDGKQTLVLIQEVTEIKIITDGTEHKKTYSGLVTFVNDDGIEIENEEMIRWEYVKSICVL